MPKNLITTYKHHCIALTKEGILSNVGRKKHVVNENQVTDAVSTLLGRTDMIAYQAQVSLLLVVMLFSGLRLGSLIPPAEQFQEDWPYIKWKVFITFVCYYFKRRLKL